MSLGLVDAELELKVKSNEIRHVSPSLLNDADICLRRGVYHLTEPRSGATEATVGGTAYHAALETYYEWRKGIEEGCEPGSAFPSDWPAPSWDLMQDLYGGVQQSLVEATPEEFEWDTSHSETIERVQHMIYRYFAGAHYWPSHFKVLGTEVGFVLSSTVPGWAEVGHIDLIMYDTINGDTILEDHKTAGKKWRADKQSPRKNNQPAMYDEAWERGTGVKPDMFSFAIMQYDGTFERRIVYVQPPTRALMDSKKATMLPLLAAGAAGELELPGNTQSALCTSKWCDYWDICPFGGALVNGSAHPE